MSSDHSEPPKERIDNLSASKIARICHFISNRIFDFYRDVNSVGFISQTFLEGLILHLRYMFNTLCEFLDENPSNDCDILMVSFSCLSERIDSVSRCFIDTIDDLTLEQVLSSYHPFKVFDLLELILVSAVKVMKKRMPSISKRRAYADTCLHEVKTMIVALKRNFYRLPITEFRPSDFRRVHMTIYTCDDVTQMKILYVGISND